MHSHHSHSGQFCRHATGTLEGVIQTAIEKGFKIFGLSEHVPKYRPEDRYPEEEVLSLLDLASMFDDYVTEAHRLRTQYSQSHPQLKILIGLETDYITTLDLDKLEEQLSKYGDKIEYLIGSVHHIDSVPIDYGKDLFDGIANKLALATVPKAQQGPVESKAPEVRVVATATLVPNLDPLISKYLDMQLEVMKRFHPEVLGHFDIFRLYYPSYSLSETQNAEVWGKMRRNIEYAVSYGALFELNAAAFRKGWNQGYPGKEIAELIISLGGHFTLSDDSHGPAFVGLNYHKLFAYTRDTLGIEEIWHLERCEERNKGGRLVRAVKWVGNGKWSESEFWKALGC